MKGSQSSLQAPKLRHQEELKSISFDVNLHYLADHMFYN